MLQTKEFQKFIRLTLAKRKLEAKVKQINLILEHMAQPLIDHMVDEEVDKLSLKGVITRKLDRTIWAKIIAKDEFGAVDKERVVAALRDAGLNELINAETYNSQSLSKYIRDLAKAQKKIPDEIADVVKANPVPKLIVTKL
jgi:hypothetical protein